MLRSSKRPSEPRVPARNLSLPEAYSLLAALMQFVGMLLLCVAIYMRNWIRLEPDESRFGPRPFVLYTFGLPYKMNTSGNNSEALYFFQKNPHPLRLTVITLCFLNLCFGVTAFLLDYLESQVLEKYRIVLVSSFHVFSGVATMILVVICVWCFQKVNRWFLEPEWKKHIMLIYFGESFYIGLLTFGCASWAVVFTLCAMGLSWKLETPGKAPDTKQ